MEHVILRWETARCATDEVMTPPLTRRFAPPSRTKSFSPLAGEKVAEGRMRGVKMRDGP